MRTSEKSMAVINGPRPSPLMINKDSHTIRRQRVPIIIYTQSPKIIHTKAQDFMALVQRLTGMTAPSSSLDHREKATTTAISPKPIMNQEASETFGSSLSDGGDETSSGNVDEASCVKGGGATANNTVQFHSPSILDFANMPLFTPNSSSDFFCLSSRPVYQFSDSPYGILGSLISPSGLGFIKDLPDY